MAVGCRFTFLVNRNGTGDEIYSILQSGRGQQCNTTLNQRNGYTDISVLDMETNGMLGRLPLPAEVVVVDSEAKYSELTGCIVERGQSTR